jgi:hypothetical protein
MSTRALMSASALFMALLGLIGTFLPREALEFFGSRPETLTAVLVQVTAALYLGFAIVNWTARGSIIGGIYGRPVTLGNFLHFAVVATLLIKTSLAHQAAGLGLFAGVYTLFGAWFGWVLFTHPGSRDPGSR